MTVPADTLPSHPVLFINPRSGGGKAQHHHLVDHCRQKRIEPIVLEEGDDLASLAAAAVSSGADAIGMAGGDGSQAEVAAVAAAHDLPYVCVPAGTRNHFALDIGIDRDDVVGALDAFHHGSERRIDLAQVNGRVFVNNASMGLYGKIVQSPEYRARQAPNRHRNAPRSARPRAPSRSTCGSPVLTAPNTAAPNSCWCPTTPTNSTRSGPKAPAGR